MNILHIALVACEGKNENHCNTQSVIHSLVQYSDEHYEAFYFVIVLGQYFQKIWLTLSILGQGQSILCNRLL